MKFLIMNILLVSPLSAGFFKEEENGEMAKKLENERLCKLFTKKVEDYKKNMRDDILAKTTLASYKHRAALFCGKAEASENNSSK